MAIRAPTDTTVCLANGVAYAPAVEELDEKKHPEAFEVFRNKLISFAVELAQLVVRGTNFVTVTVRGAEL